MSSQSPLSNMDLSFRTYLNQRLAKNALHITGDDVPDYAYGMDYELRKRLDSIPGLLSFAKKLYGTIASNQMQEANRSGVCVSPTQFPDVYAIACECADRLGIAIPNVYILNNQATNASACCMDDIQPFIIVYSGMYERVTPGELKACIGHECGHIQNNHLVYQNFCNMLLNGAIAGVSVLAQQFVELATYGAEAALYAWSRAAEVTADRAGMICADTLMDSHMLNAKLMYGATWKEQEIDFAALREQLDMQMGNVARWGEWISDHPSTVRRIVAEQEFAECETFYAWRPDRKRPDSILRSKEECDRRCKTYIDLSSGKGAE